MERTLSSRIESLLFIAQRPLPIKKISELTCSSIEDVRACLASISRELAERKSGIVLLVHNNCAELATYPDNTDIVRAYTREEVTGDLTRPGLETLTVIAYRGPVTKVELERVRGVNCTIVLRNLMMRGYVETLGSEKGESMYVLSFDFLRHLGVQNTEELPDYALLHNDEKLAQMLASEQLQNV